MTSSAQRPSILLAKSSNAAGNRRQRNIVTVFEQTKDVERCNKFNMIFAFLTFQPLFNRDDVLLQGGRVTEVFTETVILISRFIQNVVEHLLAVYQVVVAQPDSAGGTWHLPAHLVYMLQTLHLIFDVIIERLARKFRFFFHYVPVFLKNVHRTVFPRSRCPGTRSTAGICYIKVRYE